LLEVHHNVFAVKKIARKWNIKNCIIFYSVVLSWLTKFNMSNRHLEKHNARNIFCFLFLLIPFEYLMGIMGIKKNPMTVLHHVKPLRVGFMGIQTTLSFD
jgi:glycopeptide antibiotics resistance protein